MEACLIINVSIDCAMINNVAVSGGKNLARLQKSIIVDFIRTFLPNF